MWWKTTVIKMFLLSSDCFKWTNQQVDTFFTTTNMPPFKMYVLFNKQAGLESLGYCFTCNNTLFFLPNVATIACLDAHLHIPCCIDVWLHLQGWGWESLASMGTLIDEGQGGWNVSHSGHTIVGRKKRPKSVLYLGQASCVPHMNIFVCVSVVYKLSHCSQL